MQKSCFHLIREPLSLKAKFPWRNLNPKSLSLWDCCWILLYSLLSTTEKWCKKGFSKLAKSCGLRQFTRFYYILYFLQSEHHFQYFRATWELPLRKNRLFETFKNHFQWNNEVKIIFTRKLLVPVKKHFSIVLPKWTINQPQKKKKTADSLA